MKKYIVIPPLVSFAAAVLLWALLHFFASPSAWPSPESPPRQGEALSGPALAHGEIKHSAEALGRTIREPQNTWSNLAFIFVAAALFPLLRPGFQRQSCYALFGLGVGSFLYHASASREFRNVDVAGMFWVCFYLLVFAVVAVNPRSSNFLDRYPKFVAVATVLAAVAATCARNVHVLEFKPLAISFVTVFSAVVSILALTIVSVRSRTPMDWLVLFGVLLLLSIAAVCEEADRPGQWACDPSSPIQLHAVWHVLGAIGCGLLFYRLAAATSVTPNQSLEPMARSSTPRAGHESRRLSPWLTIKR